MKKNMVFYDPDEARILGMTQAVIYQQLRYWINFNEKRNQNYHDGSYWTFFNIHQLEELLGTPSRTLYDNIRSLESKGYIKTGNYNKLKFDRTKWYALTDKKPLEDGNENIQVRKTEMDVPYTSNIVPNTDVVFDNYESRTSQLRKSPNNTREVKYSNNNSNNSSKNNSNISSNTNSGDFLTHQYSEQEFFEDYLKRKGLV